MFSFSLLCKHSLICSALLTCHAVLFDVIELDSFTVLLQFLEQKDLLICVLVVELFYSF